MRTFPQALYLVAAGAALLGEPSTREARAQGSPQQFALSPGVVVDKEANRIFVMVAGDTPLVAALEAISGKILWTNGSAVRPVDVTADHQVLSLGTVDEGQNVVGAMLLDGNSGEVRMRAPLPFPKVVSPAMLAAGSANFEISAMTTDDESVLQWEYRPPARLRALPPGTLQGLPTTGDAGDAPAALGSGGGSRGTLRINLRTGEAQPVEEGEEVNFAPEAMAVDEAPLLPNVEGPKYLSADGRHVMARRRTKGEAYRFELLVFGRESQELMARFPSKVAWAPFYVEGSRVVLQTEETASREGDRLVPQPRQVKAIDIESGQVVWQQPIAEVESRVPPPP